jgi:hypothetical protein
MDKIKRWIMHKIAWIWGQKWFWTKEWQELEKQVDKDIEDGEIETFDNIDDFIEFSR